MLLVVRVLFVFICFSICFTAQSHGGRTNSDGCHNNRKTGEYHCHNSGKKTKARQSQARSSVRSLLNPNKNNFTCSGKTVCREMKSCDEAKFYLDECKVHSLDGDNDGVPCESICGG
ncbi:excalibur calcium-binding domain-containing protein [Marinicella sediminis]|uniref:Excalibur calcium-binding domain-containing protein n=1 Tax=Marinicella sediminis TaxID=1792834 RepID=A0ABV7JAT9_9GAMM|nr:excalibur calcium-binding domain-containing protein [Marinicella sediminis]